MANAQGVGRGLGPSEVAAFWTVCPRTWLQSGICNVYVRKAVNVLHIMPYICTSGTLMVAMHYTSFMAQYYYNTCMLQLCPTNSWICTSVLMTFHTPTRNFALTRVRGVVMSFIKGRCRYWSVLQSYPTPNNSFYIIVFTSRHKGSGLHGVCWTLASGDLSWGCCVFGWSRSLGIVCGKVPNLGSSWHAVACRRWLVGNTVTQQGGQRVGVRGWISISCIGTKFWLQLCYYVIML